jgi:hypothetical protein
MCNPFVAVLFDGQHVRSTIQRGTVNPQWNEQFGFFVAAQTVSETLAVMVSVPFLLLYPDCPTFAYDHLTLFMGLVLFVPMLWLLRRPPLSVSTTMNQTLLIL